MIALFLSLAAICFAGECHPVLIGDNLNPGTYPLKQYRVEAPGYGGDVLAFARRSDGRPLAIHRVWTLNPSQRRRERLAGPVEDRVGITGGCVNVDEKVYNQIVQKGYRVLHIIE